MPQLESGRTKREGLAGGGTAAFQLGEPCEGIACRRALNKRLRCGRKANGASEAVMLLSLDPLATGQPVPGHLFRWILDGVVRMGCASCSQPSISNHLQAVVGVAAKLLLVNLDAPGLLSPQRRPLPSGRAWLQCRSAVCLDWWPPCRTRTDRRWPPSTWLRAGLRSARQGEGREGSRDYSPPLSLGSSRSRIASPNMFSA